MNPMQDFVRIVGAVCVAGLLASACSGISDPSNNTTEDFPGTVGPLAGPGRVHVFESKQGEYTAKIIALSPTATTVLAVFLGQDAGDGNCTRIIGQAGLATLNSTGLSGTIQKGHYCIQVYDPASELGSAPLTADQTYTLRVSHP
jgi:hypothetical protein